MNKNQKIIELTQKVSDLESQINEIQSEFGIERADQKNRIRELEISIGNIEEEKNDIISGQSIQLEEKQNLLDQKEVKKLAKAYEDQENIYKDDTEFWGYWLVAIFTFLFISTIVSIVNSLGKPWNEKIEYYVVDIILVTILWFCSSQYSENLRLKNDYANRKTLAQSFSNILNNLSENEDIKNKFIEKTTEVLCAPSMLPDKEPVLSKEALKQMVEISKVFINKGTGG